MMDPELIKLAQEQMSKISPSELAKIQQQMMSNPELVRMAAEGMKNMRSEDLKTAAEQLKYVRPEDMVEIGEKMANATPEEIAAMRARADAQITYELNAAQMLKKQGNELHAQGRFSDAAQKYLLANKNLQGVPVANSGMLQLTCSLNLMSCYLKTRQYDECIKEGSEVLTYDSENVKALYRRGQAFKELGMLENAVSDLSKAHAVSPDDETIAGVLRDAKERMEKEGGQRHVPRGLVIEEIDEEGQTVPVESHKNSVTQPQEASECLQSASKTGGLNPDAACFHGLNDDPEALRSFQNFIANADPNTLAALSAGKSDVPPDMVKTASNMISKMTPEELQKMIQMASSFKGKSSFFNGGSVEANGDSSTPGSVPPVISPEMLQTATDMMNKMSTEDLHKMFKMASSLKEKDPFSTETMMNTNGPRSDTGSRLTEAGGTSTVNRDSFAGGSSLNGLLSNSISHASPPPSLPTSTADLQDKMRDQMKDPAMRQMFTSMIKNMSPDMMANMSEQFGVKLSREDAEKAQQAMSSLSPDDLEKMMRWADRIQTGVESAKKTKNWLLGRPGMILALCMLILAIILHWLGFIGK